MLIDTHAHLQLPEFDADREGVLVRAWAAGLAAIVVVGIDWPSSELALALAQNHSRLYATAGVHPHEAGGLTSEALQQLDELSRCDKVVAIGEIGLDFYRHHSPPAVQMAACQDQLQMAAAHRLPVVVHSREAEAETWDLLSSWAAAVRNGWPPGRPLGVMHCFAGDLELAQRYIDLGFLISIAGPVTYPRSDRLARVAAGIPLNAMVVETDSPFLPPQSHRGQRNEPAHLTETVARIALLRGLTTEAVADATTANAARLFGLAVGVPTGLLARGEA